MTFTHVVCLECNHQMPPDTMVSACDECGSNWLDARYDYDTVATRWPASLAGHTLFRYGELLPIAKADPDIWLGEGNTPLVHLHQYERLFDHESIFVKDERQNPTNSFKDRQAALSVTAMKQAGITEVALASTGNAGVAYAAYCARAGVKLWLFVNDLTPVEKMREAALYGAEVIKTTGTYDETKQIAGEFAKRRGIRYDKGAKSIPGKESMKTIAFEMAEQLGALNGGGFKSPDWYIQAVSGGIGPLGVWKGFQELLYLGLIDKMPKLGIIQAAGCAPMVIAHNANLPTAEPVVPQTLITVLATGAPGYSYVQLHEAVSSNNGAMVAVEDGTAFQAMRRLASRGGLSVEPATAVAFAGLEQMLAENTITPGETVIVSGTGHTLPVESHIMGSEFVMEFGLREVGGSVDAALAQLEEKALTVLLVDDNRSDRRLFRKLLSRYKRYRLLEADSGEEAIRLITDRLPDLIVTDLTMPGMQGDELLRHIKNNPDTAHVPVVMLSGRAADEIDDPELKQMVHSLWTKGEYDTHQLVSHIAGILGDDTTTKTAETPIAKAAKAVRAVRSVDDPHTIVVIEDNPADARLTRRMLAREGRYALIEADNGRDGLKAIHENRPDLVILDLVLPDMDGFTVMERMRDDETLQNIPVIILSGADYDDVMTRVVRYGFDTVMQKGSLDRQGFLDIIKEKLM